MRRFTQSHAELGFEAARPPANLAPDLSIGPQRHASAPLLGVIARRNGEAMSTNDAETAYFAALSKWAETEMEIDPDGPNALHGADAADAGRRALQGGQGGGASRSRRGDRLHLTND